MSVIKEILDELRNTNSRNEKVEILKKYSHFSPFLSVLKYTYNPYKKYHLTSKQLTCKVGKEQANETDYMELVDRLDHLENRDYTGNKAIEHISEFLERFVFQDQVEMIRILDKDLRIGANASSINKAIPTLIPQFKVRLAKELPQANFEREELPFHTSYVSKKLDGVRCLILKENGVSKALSRQGIEFTTLSKLTQFFDGIPTDNVVWDGEVCIMENEKENFQGIMKEIRRKDHTILSPKYFIFDCISLDVFKGIEKPNNVYSDVYGVLNYARALYESECTEVLYQTLIKDWNALMNLFDHANENGWEGLMITNGEAFFEPKRTKNLLKVKKMKDDEFEVCGAEEGKGKYKGMLGALIIDVEGYPVSVGSGFSDKQRERFWKQHKLGELPDMVTVQFFEKTHDKKGNISLRFPVFKAFRETIGLL